MNGLRLKERFFLVLLLWQFLWNPMADGKPFFEFFKSQSALKDPNRFRASPVAQALVTFPAALFGLKPTRSITTQYATIHHANEHRAALVNVTSTLEVSVPSVNLENNEAISSIDCPTATEFYISFHEAKEAEQAKHEWSETPLAMLLSAEYSEKCHQWWMGSSAGSIEKGSFMVHSVHVDEPTKLKLNITYVPLQTVVNDYDVTVNHWEIPSSEVPDDLKQDINKTNGKRHRLKQWLKKLLDKNHKFFKSAHFPIELNYDKVQDRAKKSLTIIDRPKQPFGELAPGIGDFVPLMNMLQSTTVQCSNCYVQGNVALMLELKGNLRKRTYQYTLQTHGEVKFNTDWLITLHQGPKVTFPSLPVFKLPMTPWDVPGVFQFGPAFSLDLELGYEIREPAEGVSFTVGADVTLPLEFELRGGSNQEAPQLSHHLKPKLKLHPLKRMDNDKPYHVDISVGLVPRIGLAVKMLKEINYLDLSLAFPQNLVLSIEEKSNLCREGDKSTHLLVMWEQQVVFYLAAILGGYEKVLAGHRGPIPGCSLCNSCINPVSLRKNLGLEFK